jgi:hypothetical protein
METAVQLGDRPAWVLATVDRQPPLPPVLDPPQAGV